MRSIWLHAACTMEGEVLVPFNLNDFLLLAQHLPFGPFSMQIEFGQIYVSRPMYTEADGETAVLFPKEARLRNLTYAAPL